MGRSRSQVQNELAVARSHVAALEKELSECATLEDSSATNEAGVMVNGLTLKEYKRYGRQMILPQVGLPGQQTFNRTSCLVVGAGGLGCPVLQYLASTGIGCITILDHDAVELSNLNRQVLHTEERVGWYKADSAATALRAMNSSIKITSIPLAFTPSLLSRSSSHHDLFHPPPPSKPFDIIFDCTDNPTTRHLINTYSSLHSIPLVSGGAVRTEGTVGIYNLPSMSNENPCYACLFPPAPPREETEDTETKEGRERREELEALSGTGNCSDEGVLGALCGVVGMAMVCEGLRVLLGIAKPTLHLFSPLSPMPYRTIKVRPRKSTCPTCSDPNSAYSEYFDSGTDVWEEVFCERVGVGNGVEGRTKVEEWRDRPEGTLIDVRPEVEFGICSIPGSINIPLAIFLRSPSKAISGVPPSSGFTFVCRRGNDSFIAARALRRELAKEGREDTKVSDVRGGLSEWSRKVDKSFPVY